VHKKQTEKYAVESKVTRSIKTMKDDMNCEMVTHLFTVLL